MPQDTRGVNADDGHSEDRQWVPAGRVVRLGYVAYPSSCVTERCSMAA